MRINTVKLSPLEEQLYNNIFYNTQKVNEKNIFQIADICGVSPSKISKFVRKIGFSNYKDFREFLQDQTNETTPKKKQSCLTSNEIARIQDFCNNLSEKVVKNTIKQLTHYNKVVFYGEGYTYRCLNYFISRFRRVTEKDFIATDDKHLFQAELNRNSLAVLVSVSGTYYDISKMADMAKEKKSDVFVIIEERRPEVNHPENLNILYLTNTTQRIQVEEGPFTKSRSLFFVFFEIIIQELLS